MKLFLRLIAIAAIPIAAIACIAAYLMFSKTPESGYTVASTLRVHSGDLTISILVPKGWTLHDMGRNSATLTSPNDDADIKIGEFFSLTARPPGEKQWAYVPFSADPAVSFAAVHDRFFPCRCGKMQAKVVRYVSTRSGTPPAFQGAGETIDAEIGGTFVYDGQPRTFKAYVMESRPLSSGRWYMGRLTWESGSPEAFECLQPVMDSIINSTCGGSWAPPAGTKCAAILAALQPQATPAPPQ